MPAGRDLVATGPLLLILLAGCATLTPEQSTGLKEAQRFADQVTRAYGLPQVRVIPNAAEPGLYDYSGQLEWITIEPRLLGSEDQAVMLARLVGAHTLGSRGESAKALLAVNRRGVEIMVRFLDMTERQAVDRLAKLFLAANDFIVEQERRRRLGLRPVKWPIRYSHPCAQLREFWASNFLSDAQPTCDPGAGWTQ